MFHLSPHAVDACYSQMTGPRFEPQSYHCFSKYFNHTAVWADLLCVYFIIDL